MSRKNIETRTRILQATIKTLEEQGGQGVRMGDIAKAAGISRQAVYLHFASRAELLIAATRHLDEILGLDQRLEPSRNAASGTERLERYIEFWGQYIPEIYSVAKALILAQASDEEAAAAWDDRMQAMREGCQRVIEMLDEDGQLATEWSIDNATDALWTMLLVPNWENLTIKCGWLVTDYVKWMTQLAKRTLMSESPASS